MFSNKSKYWWRNVHRKMGDFFIRFVLFTSTLVWIFVWNQYIMVRNFFRVSTILNSSIYLFVSFIFAGVNFHELKAMGFPFLLITPPSCVLIASVWNIKSSLKLGYDIRTCWTSNYKVLMCVFKLTTAFKYQQQKLCRLCIYY